MTSKITKVGKLLYGFSFRLLDYSRFEAPPPLIFVCIGFNFNRTSKGKEKVILQAIVRVWFVRLYGKIIHERQRVDYRPYRCTNHTLTSLLHLYASAPCTLRDI